MGGLDAPELAACAVAGDGLGAAASRAVVLVAEQDACVGGGAAGKGREGDEGVGELHVLGVMLFC